MCEQRPKERESPPRPRRLCQQGWLPCVRGGAGRSRLKRLLRVVSLKGFGSFPHGHLETRVGVGVG